jgi:hypothetical protein
MNSSKTKGGVHKLERETVLSLSRFLPLLLSLSLPLTLSFLFIPSFSLPPHFLCPYLCAYLFLLPCLSLYLTTFWKPQDIPMTVEEAKIMKTQNKAYVSMRYAMDKKKAEKLQNGLHFIGAKVVAWYCVAGLFVFGFVFGFVFVFVPVSSFSSFDRFFVFGCI